MASKEDSGLAASTSRANNVAIAYVVCGWLLYFVVMLVHERAERMGTPAYLPTWVYALIVVFFVISANVLIFRWLRLESQQHTGGQRWISLGTDPKAGWVVVAIGNIMSHFPWCAAVIWIIQSTNILLDSSSPTSVVTRANWSESNTAKKGRVCSISMTIQGAEISTRANCDLKHKTNVNARVHNGALGIVWLKDWTLQ